MQALGLSMGIAVTDDALAMTQTQARLGFAPGPVFRLFGMRRSGNHAVADWLARNAPRAGSVFLNNCRPASDPLSSFRMIEVNRERRPARKAQRDLAAQTGTLKHGALVLISYEDLLPGEVVPSLPGCDLLLYRGFLNWTASLLRKVQGNEGFSPSRRASIVLRAIDSYARLLTLAEAPPEGTQAICYDDWIAAPEARAELLARLGLPGRDTSLGRVQPYGGGSSFQKDITDPAQLAADRRWQQMADDPDYRDILRLAARDPLLMAPVARRFPDDAARLAELTPGAAP